MKPSLISMFTTDTETRDDILRKKGSEYAERWLVELGVRDSTTLTAGQFKNLVSLAFRQGWLDCAVEELGKVIEGADGET